jgi:predicted nuclease of restriction endonuclease-like RecB superfamily
LIDDFVRLEGRQYRDVLSFLQEPPKVSSPPAKRLMAVWMLNNMCARQPTLFDVGELRNDMVVEAQRTRDLGRFNRSDVIAAVAKRFEISPAELNEHMFSDLPMERRLVLPDPIPDPHSLAISREQVWIGIWSVSLNHSKS